ncbi:MULTISPECIES: cytochrome b/b6 domain-containing protein [unclassified Leptolyngbya]|uniref:cytochrome b/b6 domain-containing protein n=1 Tax=unclassified Leptolyngbya TaxID=2650499 RepID=UPI00168A06A9|nr:MULTISPECIES: cytochrome b/b6 domain-containing protein [unclassified Leptolyngbya]MBD1911571.1 cytochrome b/b6 domain-containing protein [Leptolyngbya sp. FACHB-8]MBD2155605.1 cytochrome b/b6 domain-containing protein [Leptolyngbya sp. FACHB-16]
MPASRPYQPLLLRLLHGLTGGCAIAAILTAYWTYTTYDNRWGGLPLPLWRAVEGIHGTFGLWTLLLFPALTIYALRRGQNRLLQTNTADHLQQIGQPIWWYTLHRATNSLMLLALTTALFTGKMMDSTWLPQGELTHAWYYAHLTAWVGLVMALALHLLMSAKIGGRPLLLSIWDWRFRPQDHPRHWWPQILQSHKTWSLDAIALWVQTLTAYKVAEISILLSLAIAWIAPLFK